MLDEEEEEVGTEGRNPGGSWKFDMVSGGFRRDVWIGWEKGFQCIFLFLGTGRVG